MTMFRILKAPNTEMCLVCTSLKCRISSSTLLCKVMFYLIAPPQVVVHEWLNEHHLDRWSARRPDLTFVPCIFFFWGGGKGKRLLYMKILNRAERTTKRNKFCHPARISEKIRWYNTTSWCNSTQYQLWTSKSKLPINAHITWRLNQSFSPVLR